MTALPVAEVEPALMPSVGVIIPARTEVARGIAQTITDVQKTLLDHYPASDFSVVVVNNGSTDNTKQVAEDAGATVIDASPGKGNALREGFLQTPAQYKAMIDADGSFRPTDLLKLLKVLQSGKADIAIGARSHGWGLRDLGSVGLARACEFIAPTGVSDAQCGLKAFRGEVIDELLKAGYIPPNFSFDRAILHYAHRLGYTVQAVPIRVDKMADSKVNVLVDGLRLIEDSFRIRRSGQQLKSSSLA